MARRRTKKEREQEHQVLLEAQRAEQEAKLNAEMERKMLEDIKASAQPILDEEISSDLQLLIKQLNRYFAQIKTLDWDYHNTHGAKLQNAINDAYLTKLEEGIQMLEILSHGNPQTLFFQGQVRMLKAHRKHVLRTETRHVLWVLFGYLILMLFLALMIWLFD